MQVGRLIARAAVGGIFTAHGLQKLLGLFDGPGLHGATHTMEMLGLEPAKQNAQLAALTETAGGALFALGAATPLAGAGLIGMMITAIRTVHLPHGPFIADGGYEYCVALIAAVMAILDGGPGDLSIDGARGGGETGSLAALGALALGAAASTAVIEYSKRLKG